MLFIIYIVIISRYYKMYHHMSMLNLKSSISEILLNKIWYFKYQKWYAAVNNLIRG